MCLICVEFQKQKMTIRDAQRALREMSTQLEPEHVKEVKEMLQQVQKEQVERGDDAP